MSDSSEPRSADPVSASESWEWKIELYNLRGQTYVEIKTECKWRPKQARLALYEGDPPKDPRQWKMDTWWAPGQAKPWNTGQPWGPGWSAALLAMDGDSSEGGTYHYVVKTEASKASGS